MSPSTSTPSRPTGPGGEPAPPASPGGGSRLSSLRRRAGVLRSAAGSGPGADGGGGAPAGGTGAVVADQRVAGPLVGVVAVLTVFGLVMVLSASSVSSLHQYGGSTLSTFFRQVMWAGIGAVAFVAASRFDYHRLRRLATPLLVLTIVLLVAVLVPGIGVNANGSSRWLGIGPFVFQPAEVAKLATVLFSADLLARRSRHCHRHDVTVRPVMVVVGVLSGLLLLQPKLGTPIILGAVVLLLLFAAGTQVRGLVPWAVVGAVGAIVLAFSADYRKDRLLAFLDPWQDPLGNGMQVLQSQVGIASGGILGVGLGASRAKWGFLPYAHTDFIFAVVAEETGLLGAGALIGLFVLLGVFGFRAALRAPDLFGMLLAAGITTWLLLQAFLNIGMALGVMPVTGEPLPFVSAGGSSLVAALLAVGIVTNVARQART